MPRPKKDGVDYFSHDTDATSRKTLFTLESKYGNDGYAFWFKLLEVLGQQKGHFYDCSNEANWLFLVAKTRVDEDKAENILQTLVKVEAIDPDLWKEQKIIWCQNFVDRLSGVYYKRGIKAPDRPGTPENSAPAVSESTSPEAPTDLPTPAPAKPEGKPVIELLLNDGSLYPVTGRMVGEWRELYPKVDVEQELRNMKGWLISNPIKRKTRRGILRFINNWLAGEQDKGGPGHAANNQSYHGGAQKPATGRTGAPGDLSGFKTE